MLCGSGVDSHPVSSVPRPLIAVLVVTAVFFALWTVSLKHMLGSSSPSKTNSPSQPALQSAINQAKGVQALVNHAATRAGGTPTAASPPASGVPSSSSGTTTNGAPTATASGTPSPNSSSAPATGGHPNAATTATTTTSPANSAKSGSAGANQPGAHGTTTIASAAAAGAAVGTIPQVSASHPTGMAVVDRALDQHKVLALLLYNPAAPDDRAVAREMRSIPTQNGAVVKMSVPLQQLGHFSDLLNEVPVNFSPTLVLIDRARQATEITGFADPFEIDQRVADALTSKPPKTTT